MIAFQDLEPRVFLTRVWPRTYQIVEGASFPEIPPWVPVTNTLIGLRRLFINAGLDAQRLGEEKWNPLADVVASGSKVVLKPNWVLHERTKGVGEDCLVTHTHLIEAILAYLYKVEDCEIVLGDAPVQGCDFDVLLEKNHIARVVDTFGGRFTAFDVVDFRKTIMVAGGMTTQVRKHCREDTSFVLFDLGSESLLEPISSHGTPFRVTDYDARYLEATHRPGRHQYLVAKEIMDADVVFNLPKLKTHKKAGITGALKNMVGINGHKEYLPHHRKGGSARGGDCYEESSLPKTLAEGLLDMVNRRPGGVWHRAGAFSGAVLRKLAVVSGGDDNLDGSWPGNDTVWRMALDLQRILHYGSHDGLLGDEPRRKVVTLTDAVIAGQGDGPLAPEPCPCGVLSLARSTAAAELVNSYLLGLDPERVPIVREAFELKGRPIIRGARGEVVVVADEGTYSPIEAGRLFGVSAVPPVHWRGKCELMNDDAETQNGN